MLPDNTKAFWTASLIILSSCFPLFSDLAPVLLHLYIHDAVLETEKFCNHMLDRNDHSCDSKLLSSS
jgi:hypothetical protein